MKKCPSPRLPRACVQTIGYAVASLWMTAALAQAPSQAKPSQAPPSPVTSQLAGQAAPTRFAVNAFDVSGVKSLSQSEIERLIYPFEGPDRTSDDVEGARKAIQDAYAKRGLEAVVVEIPNQPTELFEQGIVQISVSEVPVGQVRVTGARFHSSRPVRSQMPTIVEGKPLDLKGLQTDLADANHFPDRSITPSFKPGQTPGTVDVELRVKDDRPYHASIQIDNDASPSTSKLRLTASARYTNLWQAGHTLTATSIVTPQNRKETEVISGSYLAPFIGSPWSVLVYGYKSNSNIAALGGTNVLGRGYQVGLRGVYRLPSQKISQSISFGLDFKNFKQDIFVGTTNASTAPIKYIPFVLEYSGGGGGETTTFNYSAGATLGLRTIRRVACFDASATPANCILQDQFKNKDFDSNENFVHANFSLDYSRATKSDFVAAVKFTGQFSDSHLVTNEQYAIGGLSSVRGYFQSEAVGDDGIAGSLELRLPSLASLIGGPIDELRFYAFVDGGYVRVRKVLAEQTADFKLASVGGGARFKIFKYFTGEALVGVPLIDGPSSRKGNPRATLVARGEF